MGARARSGLSRLSAFRLFSARDWLRNTARAGSSFTLPTSPVMNGLVGYLTENLR
jgi:hypothetical protein